MHRDAPPGALDPRRLRQARAPLAEAWTLPAQAFTDPAIYELEKERIFSRTWLCAGRADQIPEAGDYFSLDLFDERLVIVRDGQTIRALSRVCRHRAAEVVNGAGRARSFQCPYHAWTYRLDGRLLGAPHMDQADGFDRANCALPEVRSEVWEGFVFVNFDANAAPLGAQLASVSKRLSRYRMSELVAVETATFESPFNWKVLTDNFMEAYHHIGIHKNTLEPLFPAKLSSAPDSDGPWSLLDMPSEAAPEPGPGDEEHRLTAGAVFPFHLFAPSANSMAWYQLLPQSHDHFTLRIFTCFPPETLENPLERDALEGLQELTRRVHTEDIGACQAVWAGLASQSFEAGRLSHLEKPIWQFNRWWIEQMTGAS